MELTKGQEISVQGILSPDHEWDASLLSGLFHLQVFLVLKNPSFGEDINVPAKSKEISDTN